MPTVVYRSSVGQVLTAMVGALCALTAVITAVGGGLDDLVRFGPWLALVAGGCWALFWRPRVEVSDGGVRLVNVTRTVHVPWPAIHRIDTRWALTLDTAYGRFTAWGAPASGRGPVRKAARDGQVTRVSPGAAGSDLREVAPGSQATVRTGGAAADAAELVRQRWDQLRTAGHLDDPALEHARVPVRWHIETIAAGALLVGLGVVGLMV